MAENRVPRELSNREKSARPQQWRPPETLPEPIKEAGYEYHWKRVSILNEPDQRNISSSYREGWEAVRIEEQPHMKLLADPDGRYKDNILIGGLLLCKRPEEMGQQEKAYYANVTRQQTDAVDNNLMRQSDPRMPIFNERKSTTTFGRGSV
jgi:hypothetical protein